MWPIPTEAPWRNGTTERLGGEWKKTFDKMMEDTVVQSHDDLGELIDAVNVGRNEAPGKSGYTSFQRALGRSPFLRTSRKKMAQDTWGSCLEC